jgi:hypothetical protein
LWDDKSKRHGPFPFFPARQVHETEQQPLQQVVGGGGGGALVCRKESLMSFFEATMQVAPKQTQAEITRDRSSCEEASPAGLSGSSSC